VLHCLVEERERTRKRVVLGLKREDKEHGNLNLERCLTPLGRMACFGERFLVMQLIKLTVSGIPHEPFPFIQMRSATETKMVA
jgi:hypothetical protein